MAMKPRAMKKASTMKRGGKAKPMRGGGMAKKPTAMKRGGMTKKK